MIKVKWLYSELPISLSQLSNLMKENQYSESTGAGFLLSSSTETKLVGRYIEKIISKMMVEDPFGETSEIDTVSYYTCRFNWLLESPYMYVSDPPRSLRKFVNKIHEMTGLGLVLSELDISLEKWLNQLELDADLINVVQISSFGIRTSSSSTAKISVSGSKDVRSEFTRLVSEKRYKIDSIKFEGVFDRVTVKGELTKSGLCRLKTQNTPYILELLRMSLASHSD